MGTKHKEALAEHEAKRDFDETPEPRPVVSPIEGHRFVVQLGDQSAVGLL